MGALGFAAPYLLAGLLLLPALYFLLRLTPPQPRQVWFPPLKLIARRTQDETPQSSPLWLILLRLALAACLIFAFAKPLLRGEPATPLTSDPLVLIIDNGWASAPDWAARRAQGEDLLARAEAQKIPVLLATSNAEAAQSFNFTDARTALNTLFSLTPEPFLAKRAAMLGILKQRIAQRGKVQVVWISDGMAGEDGAEFLAQIAELSPLVLTAPKQPLQAILSAANGADAFEAALARTDASGPVSGTLRAYDRQNRLIGSSIYNFAAGVAETRAALALPTHLRNDVFRLDLAGQPHAGAAFLLDERFRRKTVGLYSGGAQNSEQIALSSAFILDEALRGFADVSKATGSLDDALRTFVRDRVGVIMLSDTGALPADMSEALSQWVNDGGVLLRFAGIGLAGAEPDGFLPVRLRPALRVLGGELSWEKPQGLGRAGGALLGLEVANDVTVTRQALAEATSDLAAKTWLDLADGTPLITAEARGRGHVVFVHVSPDPAWSNLPLSGTFLSALRKIVALSAMASSSEVTPQRNAATDLVLKPFRSLTASGALAAPPASAKSIPIENLGSIRVDAEHPPGLYGSDGAFQALNTVREASLLAPLAVPADIRSATFAKSHDQPLGAAFFIAALVLFIADILLSVLLLGRVRMLKPAAVAMLAVFSFGVQAQDNGKNRDMTLGQSANVTRLGLVRTGVPDIDDIAQAGLRSLSQILRQRTSIRLEEPAMLDLAKDELVFYPVLYWPIDSRMNAPDAAGLAKAESFIRNGGTILFDTRDRGDGFISGMGGASQAEQMLRGILAKINAPRIEPIPQDHVLTKAFYILTGFPGRFEDGPLFVEVTKPNGQRDARPVRLADGVSSVIVTGNDMAGAWATDGAGTPLLPLYGSNERQREFAIRAGVNIVVYALTGNYKADQVHVPDLLKRLGQ